MQVFGGDKKITTSVKHGFDSNEESTSYCSTPEQKTLVTRAVKGKPTVDEELKAEVEERLSTMSLYDNPYYARQLMEMVKPEELRKILNTQSALMKKLKEIDDIRSGVQAPESW
jgi:hypothetical protein